MFSVEKLKMKEELTFKLLTCIQCPWGRMSDICYITIKLIWKILLSYFIFFVKSKQNMLQTDLIHTIFAHLILQKALVIFANTFIVL